MITKRRAKKAVRVGLVKGFTRLKLWWRLRRMNFRYVRMSELPSAVSPFPCGGCVVTVLDHKNEWEHSEAGKRFLAEQEDTTRLIADNIDFPAALGFSSVQ